MSVASRTREAVRARPFLRDALAAGVVNYAAAAASLDVDADREAVAAALRRYESELAVESPGTARVRLHRGVERTEDGRDAVVAVGGAGFREADGDYAAVTAHGDAVDAIGLERVLGRLRTTDVSVTAAGAADDTLVVVVPARTGANALRVTETVFE